MINTTRHEDIIKAHENDTPICIIGAGAVGSRLFAALVEFGFTKITVVDFDSVESHNLANQLFQEEDIGQLKIAGLERWATAKLGKLPKGIQFIEARLPNEAVVLEGTIFMAVDTMAGRRQIYDECIVGNDNIFRVIEMRMAASHGNIMTFIPPVNGDQWIDTLIEDDASEVSACGSNISVGATASICANIAAWQYVLRKVDPDAADDIVNFFLKPLIVGTESWQQ